MAATMATSGVGIPPQALSWLDPATSSSHYVRQRSSNRFADLQTKMITTELNDTGPSLISYNVEKDLNGILPENETLSFYDNDHKLGAQLRHASHLHNSSLMISVGLSSSTPSSVSSLSSLSSGYSILYSSNENVTSAGSDDVAEKTAYIAIFSTLFFIIGSVGITGNGMVVYIVLSDSKMRKSMTNMLILNLAVADSLIMLFGLPEIAMFMIDKGWQLGPIACRLNRAVLVCALYASVLTLVAVCIERYIAIVFPIKAHIFCTKRRVLVVIILIWCASILCSLPIALFNAVVRLSNVPPREFCLTKFHDNRTQHDIYDRIFKYTESSLFYIGPMVLQVVCYAVIGKRLFVGMETLHRTQGGISSASRPNGRGPSAARGYCEAIKARRGVVKMLMASVAIYFISYSPHQILLVYKTFSSAGFEETWVYHVFTITLAYINSAANPVLYCVFSDNFRTKFRQILHGTCCSTCCKRWCCNDVENNSRPINLNSYTEYSTLVRRSTQRVGQGQVTASV